ncbi:uncharacterized protein LOC115482942 isoform X2 [Drosophila hydei]|uniref:Uncharacterized protein LOC115482942 isoform X2 n=1 Tax=Drosophila hydei TaxID=7224 RepID=A0A6J2SQ00_DROHY|nr:uncharacterized protein LOC115482942 isoform X2 [Drosophila hydei]
MQNSEDHNIPLLEEIIYPDVEPGIINRSMIETCYLEDAHRGEERRLHQLEPVVLDKIESIRMEFKRMMTCGSFT